MRERRGGALMNNVAFDLGCAPIVADLQNIVGNLKKRKKKNFIGKNIYIKKP